MKIKMYEEMLESIKQFEAEQQGKAEQLGTVVTEVENARQRLNDLIEQATDLENPEELAVEVGKAQGMLTIAESKLNRLKAVLEVERNRPGKQFPNGITVAFQNVQSEIRKRINDGSLLQEEFQPILDELDEHRQTYMAKLEAVFIKMHQLNKNLSHIQHSTASAVTRYTGKEQRFGMLGPEQLSESDFNKWAWVEKYSYDNDLASARKAALKAVHPEVILPPPPTPPNVVYPSSNVAPNARIV
ncbi:hypothetical protein HP570_20370 [Brevibacillus sp. RS1.1]|uniref:hypothetical protein n=1 Tax=Brevibacillus sp. RS1.1 TaxID=2738982 RepID=UPI00156A77A7|nr:hypothetical protein [Brevibacillus sp. RS1.1]NRR04573.1 hypothetical protein [Brevibacillus sp. RS1.1]